MSESDINNIYDTNNYREKFKATDYKKFSKLFIELINEYLTHTKDKILIQNQSKYIFVLERGIETISHIYNQLLLYTKNIELTIYHCERAYAYYVEFIGQIGDDKNSYLQLNSKDATLFVYKKTIFEVNNDFRKKFEIDDDDKIVLETTKNINNMYKKILLNILHTDEISIENNVNLLPFAMKSASKAIEKVINYEESNLYKLRDTLKISNKFIDLLGCKKLDTIKYSKIIESFLKKQKKVKIDEKVLLEKFNNGNFNKFINNLSSYKFTLWLFG